MATLSWGTAGEKVYEAGADRGVLYIDGSSGVAWNGLISVTESPSGGEPTPYYIDGLKYLNISSGEEFEATIEAYSSPKEFDVCDGNASIAYGLFISQQPRKPFNFCYRTMIGNDVEGVAYGYKLHLIYNALAAPSEITYNTINDSPEAATYSWSITTMPAMIDGYKPSAHFVIDSTKTPKILLDELEGMIYGTTSGSPYLPTPNDILALFDDYVTIDLLTMQFDGTYQMQSHEAFMRPTTPILPSGQESLWIDTSAGTHSSLRYVIGD